MTQCRCCSWDNPIWALSCPVTATSTERPRRISDNTCDYLSSCVYPSGQVVPDKTEKFCLFWVLQKVTHLQRQNTISRLFCSTASVCPCSKPKQISDGHVLSPVLLCVHSLPRKEDGDRGRCVTWYHPHSKAVPGDFFLHEEKKHTEDFEWSNCKARLSLQSTEDLNPLLPYAWHTEVKWIHQTDSYFIPIAVVNERWREGSRINPQPTAMLYSFFNNL